MDQTQLDTLLAKMDEAIAAAKSHDDLLAKMDQMVVELKTPAEDKFTNADVAKVVPLVEDFKTALLALVKPDVVA